MAINIFQDNTKSIPKSSPNIVRVSMTENEIAGRKDHMPKAESSKADIMHVSNSGGEGGGGKE